MDSALRTERSEGVAAKQPNEEGIAAKRPSEESRNPVSLLFKNLKSLDLAIPGHRAQRDGVRRRATCALTHVASAARHPCSRAARPVLSPELAEGSKGRDDELDIEFFEIPQSPEGFADQGGLKATSTGYQRMLGQMTLPRYQEAVSPGLNRSHIIVRALAIAAHVLAFMLLLRASRPFA